MSPPPRRLTFAVSSSLLTASLALGCTAGDESAKKKDEKTEKPEAEGPMVNTVEPPTPEPEPGLKVNPGPDELEKAPPEIGEGPSIADGATVNTVAPPEPRKQPVKEEPKHVNTGPKGD
jgi:hypothetical protein